MAIQHRDIQEADLHEPKGISLAAANTVYSSNGAGTGAWGKVNSNTLQGLGSQEGDGEKRILSDGVEGFKYVVDSAYGTANIVNNTTLFNVSAASDSLLQTDTDYKTISGSGAPWAPGSLHNTTFESNSLVLTHSGVYRVDIYADVSPMISSGELAFKLLLNGADYSTMGFHTETGQIHGFGIESFESGDFVQVAVASTLAGNITIRNARLSVSLIRT